MNANSLISVVPAVQSTTTLLAIHLPECNKLQREHKSGMDSRLSSLSHRFEQSSCTCDYYKNSFQTRTIAQWDNLSPEIIASTSPCSFRQPYVILHVD